MKAAPPSASSSSAVSRVTFLDVLGNLLPLAVLAAGIASYVGLASLAPVKEPVATPVVVPIVETTPVSACRDGLILPVDGVVVPYRETPVANEVEGRVKFKSPKCEAGNFVEKGEVLFEIDSADYELEVQRLEGQRDQAASSLAELDVQSKSIEEQIDLVGQDLVLRQRDLERITSLLARGNTTEAMVDDARRTEIAARNSLSQLKNQGALLKAQRNRLEAALALTNTQLEKARLDLARTKIVAPASGVILEEMVEQDAFVPRGTQLTRIEDVSAVEVKCNLTAEDLGYVWSQAPAKPSTSLAGQPAEKIVPVNDAGEPVLHTPTRSEAAADYKLPPTPAEIVYELGGVKYAWQGVLSRYDGLGLDEKTRMAPCRVCVAKPRDTSVSGEPNKALGPNAPRALLRGMFVRVNLRVDPNLRLLDIDERAVRPGDVVWLVRDGKLVVEPVEIVKIVGERALIRAATDR
ncbi:MAG TPA: HlyD family efflux transporter periplasmic adaptor subunit, partial [Pirellulales bacterium]